MKMWVGIWECDYNSRIPQISKSSKVEAECLADAKAIVLTLAAIEVAGWGAAGYKTVVYTSCETLDEAPMFEVTVHVSRIDNPSLWNKSIIGCRPVTADV